MELKDKKVAIIGFGISGQGATDYLVDKGATVHFYDNRYRDDLDIEAYDKYSKQGAKFYIGDEYDKNDDLLGYDMLIVSPTVKEDHPKIVSANEKEIPVYLDITLFLKLWNKKGKVVGVTGSNGKSTVVSLLKHTLDTLGIRSFLGGNIGVSPLSWLDEAKEGDIIIMELSSYQLKFFNEKQYADIAVITNLSSNHLDKHNNSMSEYAKAKLNILNKEESLVIIDLDDDGIQKYVTPVLNKKMTYGVSLKTDVSEAIYPGIYTNHNGDLTLYDEGESEILFRSSTKTKLLGVHNKYNIASVILVLNLLDIKSDKIEEAISSFNGLEHRIEFVNVGEKIYINDSKATSPDATLKALETIGNSSKNIILISGGDHKGASYETLESAFEENLKGIIFLPGIAKEKILKYLKNDVQVIDVSDMDEAVSAAKEISDKGDIILLSPGTSSMPQFKNYEDRGNKFKEAVSKYEIS